MKRESAFLSIVLALLAGCATAASSDEKPLVFTDITVIDATGGPARPHMMVTVRGGKIAAIQGYRQERVPKTAEVVDGRDKFLIPGLWDMHVHPPPEGYLPLFIANGVTGVRIMWGAPEHHQWRERIKSGTLLGPRMVIASPIIQGPIEGRVVQGWIEVKDAAEARSAVISSRNSGADFLKIGAMLSREAYLAIADEARKQRIPFVGHLPHSVRLSEASDAGQKSVEHLLGIALEASSHEEQVRKQCIAARNEALNEYCNGGQEAADTFDPMKAAEIYRRLARNRTWQVPTLRLIHNYNFMNDPALENDPRLKYVEPAMRNVWISTKEGVMKQAPAARWENSKKQWEQGPARMIRDMHRAGVPLLAGTDTPNPFLFPGFSLPDELALFVEAGLTPMEALQTATRNAAQFFGTLDSAGTIEKGKTADLVMLDANPLTDIRNTQRISGVMLGGKYFARPVLDQMLANVEALANPK